jgi:MFS family permease
MTLLSDKIKKSKLSRNVVMLGLVSLFTDVASEMIYPLIPIFVAALGSGALLLGVIEGIAETTASLLKLFSGILSDKFHKRKLLVVIGYSISSFIRPFTGMVTSAWQIVFIRMLDRIGKGIRTAPRDALIAASSDENQRGLAFGFHRAMDHTGAVIGPLLALLSLLIFFVFFWQNDWLLTLRWTFIVSLIPGLVAVWILYFQVQERMDSVADIKTFTLSFRQFDKNFLSYLTILFLFTLGNSSDAFLLFRAEEAIQKSGAFYELLRRLPILNNLIYNMGNQQSQQQLVNILFLPLVWAFFHMIKTLFSTPLGALSDQIGRKQVIMIGWGIYTLVYFAFALLDKLPGGWQITATLILFAVYAFYYAFCEGAEKALIADVVEPGFRGSAYGLYNFTVGLGTLPASIFFGLIYSTWGAQTAFTTGAGIALLSMLLLTAMVREPNDKVKSL